MSEARGAREVTAAVVAFYDETKPPGLADFVARLQTRLTELLGEVFWPRPVATTHCTLIGLDALAPQLASGDLPPDLDDRTDLDLDGFTRWLRTTVDDAGVGIRFGGYDGADPTPYLSRGLSLRHRTLVVDRGLVVLIGWPLDGQDTPTLHLDAWRRGASGFGVQHRYPLADGAHDPDAHVVIGELTRAVGPDVLSPVLEELRAELTDRSCYVPLAWEHVRVVVYDDPRLPLATTRSRPPDRLLRG